MRNGQLNGSSTQPVKGGGSIEHFGVVQPRGFPALPQGWTSEWETFTSADRRAQLFGVLHRPAENWNSPKALIVSHGLHEHGGRYLHFPHYLKESVQAVYCIDHRGHGRSEGLRGHIDHFEQFSDDLMLAIRRLDEQLQKRFGRSEIHVLGHSMGGLIALRSLFAVSNLPVRSLILSSPLLGIRTEVPMVKKLASVVLSRVWGSLQLDSGLDVAGLSHDPEVIQAYVSDRLVSKKITPRMFQEMVRAMHETADREAGLAYPILMLLPSDDPITDSSAAMKFFRNLKHRDKQMKSYPGFFHESFNEIGKERVFDELKSWLDHQGR